MFQLNIFHDRGTSAPPVFVSRFKYKKGTAVSFLYLGILCTAAWADVAEACPVMNNLVEHQKLCVRLPTKDNWKLSCIQFIVIEFMKRTWLQAEIVFLYLLTNFLLSYLLVLLLKL